MSALKATLQKAMTDAMKAKNASRLQTIRLIWNALRKKEIDDRKDLTDADIQKVLQTMMKQTQESLAQAEQAQRAEAIQECQGEIQIIQEFLPEALSEQDVEKIVSAHAQKIKTENTQLTGGALMGAVMKASLAEIGARAEGRIVQLHVKKALGLG